MIESLLPRAVSCSAAREDRPDARLFPEEEAALGAAVESRRREFATSRACARQALTQLGSEPVAILRGSKREPLWPVGIVGSITHCRGYRAAAVAFSKDFLALGIDAEPDGPLPDGVAGHVLRPEERGWVQRAPDGVPWERVFFSAKESIYKAWFPLTGRWLDFGDAIVTIDPPEGKFHAELLVEAPLGFAELSGRFLVAEGLVLTAIAIPA